MATINDEGQWIILIGFLVCISLMFLAIVVNESTLVGQTTAESVLEFSKSDIQDIRDEVARYYRDPDFNSIQGDIENLSIQRKNTLLTITPHTDPAVVTIHYNNGVTIYNENALYPR